MTVERLDPERAVRLLRAKAGEYEAVVADSHGIGLDWIRADLALIAALLADHIERSDPVHRGLEGQ
jgi:hypothetical protein